MACAMTCAVMDGYIALYVSFCHLFAVARFYVHPQAEKAKKQAAALQRTTPAAGQPKPFNRRETWCPGDSSWQPPKLTARASRSLGFGVCSAVMAT